ncbi:zinc finger protein 195 isoform X1 [Agrilus planipennis]|uniref:Zinc finger protein 195 isoform X1 n=1 Tax=Agrilus planipennis TaxID=224129 RepID=A0A7F5RMS4_AGRPL|nr:zinc finger protein 195 isoform X1 [Agrilus planipennis]
MFSVDSYSSCVKSIFQPTATVEDVTGTSALLVPGRVTASTYIPQGAMSLPIKPENIKGSPDIVQISVEINPYGTIVLEEQSEKAWNNDIHWVRLLRLSNDCHSYNIQLKLQSQRSLIKEQIPPKLILQTVRNIEPGQELLLWFSEEILALIQMSFLTPNNIQGQKKYVCMYCSVLYESPNPLKIHITLGCGRQSISTLWEKLSNALTINQPSEEQDWKSTQMFCFKLAPSKFRKQNSALDLTTSTFAQEERPNSQPSKFENNTVIENCRSLYRPFSEPSANGISAFKPFQKLEPGNLLASSYIPDFSSTFERFSRYGETTGQHCHDEAHIETIVSSLGKSKDGHVCIYCGKCYSRKYGLKIHIRTHTGYKPLKCKYCLRPFGDPSNLNKHVRLHSEGETPYRCELCGKVLVRRRDLERHLKSRHLREIHPDSSTTIEAQTAISSDDDLKHTTTSS